jgi:hypothetical protein
MLTYLSGWFISLNTVTRLCAGWPGFVSWQQQSILLFTSAVSRPVLGPTQPPIQWVLRTLLPGVEQLRHEVDHSSPSGTEIKNA